MFIYLIRHGEWFERPLELRFLGYCPKRITLGLTAFGKKQAQYLGGWLTTKKITSLYTSPLLRTKQTTTIISQALKIKPRVELDLQEIKKSSSGKEWHFWPYYTQHRYEDLNYRVEDGESVKMLIKRAGKIIREIIKKHPQKNTVVVTHAEFIKCFLSSVGYPQYLTAKEIIPFASTTVLSYQNRKFVLLGLANTQYLRPLFLANFLKKLFFKLMTKRVIYVI